MSSKQLDVYHAIADPSRRRLLDLLLQRERPVQELVAYFDVTFGAVSQHLKILFEAGLVSKRRSGRQRIYSANPRALKEVVDWTDQYRVFWEQSLNNLETLLEERDRNK